ncbi:NUDIX hydrolase [Anaerobacillus sp. 1_MG-2023]|uniref:NUDIX hydrolase n=1 Tax=Bacillales TaxID=1385 RepID=UPI0026E2D14F|nr:NUDIX domain-containing protein [Anaerobacillus sp. 1_MG-2023]MDO6654902.1 NUDIX domain-containing protein [Anaerobacillus sp. 1_MG-2023]
MIKVKALGLLFREDKILVEAFYGNHSNGLGGYFRPLGGNIELGEPSNETVVREFKEELGIDIKVEKYITCLENRYQIDQKWTHEVIQLYTVSFIDEAHYMKEKFSFIEQEAVAEWLAVEDILNDKEYCYPNGLDHVLNQLR